MLADTPSIGLLVGTPIAAIVFLGGLIALVVSLRMPANYYMGDRKFVGISGVVVMLITAVVFVAAMYPLKHDYHFWVPVHGKVERISSRFISAGKGTAQRFVVVVNGQPYGVDDTRASLLHVGDPVDLSCKKEFEWGASANGWGCRWNGGPS